MKEVYDQIGQALKDNRLKKKLSLDKISNKTKISIENLENIEEGRFHLIAGQFYQRSFIKSYAKALRINEKKILLLFDNALNGPDKKATSIESKEDDLEKNRTPIITEKIPTKPLLLFVSLSLITLFLINLYIDTDDHGGKLVTIEPRSDLKIAKIEENLVNKNEKIRSEMPMKQTNINVDDIENYKIQKNKIFLKQIIAKEDVWIEIKDLHENIILSTILKKNETFNLPNDKDDMIISASNGGALFIKNGDNKYPELGSSGDVLDSVDLNSLITNH